VRNRKPAELAWSAALANITPTVIARTTSGKILRNQPEEGIGAYEGKTLRKGRF